MRRTAYARLAVLPILGVALLCSPALADHLEAPEGVTCELDGDVILADWEDVDGAVKYSVNVEAAYDTDGDGVLDTVEEFDFGTSDRTDGGDIGDSDLEILLDDLVLGIDTDDDGIADTFFDAEAVRLRVKALDPGRGKGPQNHPFSDWCEVDFS